MVRRLAVALATVCMLAPLVRAAEVQAVGFRGDGTGFFPDTDPPVRWDTAASENVRWRCRLPTLGYTQPIVVGGRCFALSEVDADHLFPILTCIDMADGKVLWQRQINHLALAVPDEARRRQIEGAWREALRFHEQWVSAIRAWMDAKGQGEAAMLALRPRFERLGFEVTDEVLAAGRPQASGYRFIMPIAGEPAATWFHRNLYDRDSAHPELMEANLAMDFRRRRGMTSFCGDAFSTPVSDGERVFVADSYRAFACYDLEGNLIWQRWYPLDRGGEGDDCSHYRSPVVWGDVFIADLGNHIRAFDRKTGALVWEIDRKAAGFGHHEIATPVVFTVAGEDYLWCNGSPPFAVHLADGKPVKVEGWRSTGMMVAVNTDRPDTLFMTGGGEHGGWLAKGKGEEMPPAAIRLARRGDVLAATVLWQGIDGAPAPANDNTIAYHAGKVYFFSGAGLILDAETGKVLAGDAKARRPKRESPGRAAPGTALELLFAAGRVYGLGWGSKGSEEEADDGSPVTWAEVFNLDGEPLARNRVTGPSGMEAECRARGIPNWFAYPPTFTIAGDAVVLRSAWDIICVGK